MNLDRAQESLKAAELCLQAGFVNSAASRAYYAMFQAAQAALKAVGSAREEWSHHLLQANFPTELIHRRKVLPFVFRDYLSQGLRVRHVADYGPSGVSRKVAQRMVHRAASFATAIKEKTPHDPVSN